MKIVLRSGFFCLVFLLLFIQNTSAQERDKIVTPVLTAWFSEESALEIIKDRLFVDVPVKRGCAMLVLKEQR